MERFVGPDAGETRAPIERMQSVLDTGRWPSGLKVLPYERPVIEKNLAAMLASSTGCDFPDRMGDAHRLDCVAPQDPEA